MIKKSRNKFITGSSCSCSCFIVHEAKELLYIILCTIVCILSLHHIWTLNQQHYIASWFCTVNSIDRNALLCEPEGTLMYLLNTCYHTCIKDFFCSVKCFVSFHWCQFCVGFIITGIFSSCFLLHQQDGIPESLRIKGEFPFLFPSPSVPSPPLRGHGIVQPLLSTLCRLCKGFMQLISPWWKSPESTLEIWYERYKRP